MERYAEEYDVAIVGGGPDILFFVNDTDFFPFKNHLGSLTTVYLVFQLLSD
jgi:hypothetical protein